MCERVLCNHGSSMILNKDLQNSQLQNPRFFFAHDPIVDPYRNWEKLEILMCVAKSKWRESIYSLGI